MAYLAGVLDTRAIVGPGWCPARSRCCRSWRSPAATSTCSPGSGALTGVRVTTTARGYDKHRCLEHCTEAHEHITSVSGRWR